MSLKALRRTGTAVSLIGTSILFLAGCLELPISGVQQFPRPSNTKQEGALVVRDGVESQVEFSRPFQGVPRVELLEFTQTSFKDRPYEKSQIVLQQITSTGFKVCTSHQEPGYGSWAQIRWRAFETDGRKRSPDQMSPGDRLAAKVESFGGKMILDHSQSGKPPIALDLHRTPVRDADLEMLDGLTALRSLNLFGTKITDEGMKHVANLTSLQTLHLNSVAISDAGLLHLQGLSHLRELNLYETRVTDEGLRYLTAIGSLQTITLSGSHITDRGVRHLKQLPDLKQLNLYGTQVTEEAISELRRARHGIRFIYEK